MDSQQLHATTYLILTCSETYLLFLLLMGSCVFLVCLPSSVSGPPLIWGVCFSSSSTSSWQDKYLLYILYSLVKLLKVILTISPCSLNCWINKYTALFKHSSVSSLLTITDNNIRIIFGNFVSIISWHHLKSSKEPQLEKKQESGSNQASIQLRKNNQRCFIFCQTHHTISDSLFCTGAHYR